MLRLLTVLLIAAAAGLLVLQTTWPAAAQERVERKSFLQLLFGGSRTNNPAPSVTTRTSRVKAPARAQATASALMNFLISGRFQWL